MASVFKEVQSKQGLAGNWTAEKEIGIALVSVRVSGFYQGFCAEIKGMHYSGQKTRERQDLVLMPPSWEHYKVSNEAPLLAKGKNVVERGWTC